jgi:hypothetical protein
MAFDEKATGQADKFLKGARAYVEGTLKLEQWAGQDGAARHGLGCLSWHCRLAEIGRNKPRRPHRTADKPQPSPSAGTFYSDEIPLSPEWR